MIDPALVGWLFFLSLLVLALAAAAQSALTYIDRARLRHMLEGGTPKALALSRLLDEPSSTHTSVLLVYTVSIAAATASGFWLVEAWWRVSPGIAVLLGFVGTALLLVTQFIGRVVAMVRPEGTGLALVGPVELLTKVFSPFLVPLLMLERWASRALGLRRLSNPAEAEERIRMLVEENADLEEDEREMIASVIELGEQPVREVMVPRPDVTAIRRDATVSQVLDCIVDSGHSRIPIYDESVDNITGIVYAKDILKHLRDGSLQDAVEPLARAPHYVPDTKKVDELLHEMQDEHFHLAVVVDEYGGTAGLISIEDLIEEIVGEIQDEYDVEEAPIEEISETEAIFDARVSIRDVNDTLDLELDDEDFDTVGGLLFHHLGRIPVVGDEVRVNGCVARVMSTNGRRVKKVQVTRLDPVEAAPARPDHD